MINTSDEHHLFEAMTPSARLDLCNRNACCPRLCEGTFWPLLGKGLAPDTKSDLRNCNACCLWLYKSTFQPQRSPQEPPLFVGFAYGTLSLQPSLLTACCVDILRTPPGEYHLHRTARSWCDTIWV